MFAHRQVGHEARTLDMSSALRKSARGGADAGRARRARSGCAGRCRTGASSARQQGRAVDQVVKARAGPGSARRRARHNDLDRHPAGLVVDVDRGGWRSRRVRKSSASQLRSAGAHSGNGIRRAARRRRRDGTERRATAVARGRSAVRHGIDILWAAWVPIPRQLSRGISTLKAALSMARNRARHQPARKHGVGCATGVDQAADAGHDRRQVVRHGALGRCERLAGAHGKTSIEQYPVKCPKVARGGEQSGAGRSGSHQPPRPAAMLEQSPQQAAAGSGRCAPNRPSGSSRIASGLRARTTSASIETLSPVTMKPSARPSRAR